MTDCVFCKIISGVIPSDIVYQDDTVFAFRDINPAAATHILVIPRKHMRSTNDMVADDERLVGHLFFTASKIVTKEGIAETGYRLIINTGPDGGQEVFHLHLHILGGNPMRHPMG